VPAIMFLQFRTIDSEKDALLFRSVNREGKLIAAALSPLLECFGAESAERLGPAVARLGGEATNIKLLFRPDGANTPGNFFYIAATPPVPADRLEQERDELSRTGIFEQLATS